MSNTVRLAIVGGRRGGSFEHALKAFSGKIALTAVCDLDEKLLADWQQRRPGIKTTTSFDKLLEMNDVDAVLIATPMQLHGPQAVKALKAGKHVLSEVIAACTMDECWELVETVEKTGSTYMLSENYCYMRETMMIKNMAEQNVFGNVTFAEGAYIHDCRFLLYYPDGTKTWRGTLGGAQIMRGNGYPTHSLGPVSQWLGITRKDNFVRTTTFSSKDVSRHEYIGALLGKDHPDAQPNAWASSAGSASTLIETANGVVINIRVDSASPRPHNMTHYGLQGSKGAYLSPRVHGENALVWIEGVSKGADLPGSKENPQWQSLRDLADKYEHPRWKKFGEQADKAGHGGGDFFVLDDFADSIIQKKLPPIDVYDAATWSCITPLSGENVRKNGVPIDVPDFLRGKTRGDLKK
jgi:predicted dehydrogenase